MRKKPPAAGTYKKVPVFRIKVNDAKCFADALSSPEARQMIERDIALTILQKHIEDIIKKSKSQSDGRSLRVFCRDVMKEICREREPEKKGGKRKNEKVP